MSIEFWIGLFSGWCLSNSIIGVSYVYHKSSNPALPFNPLIVETSQVSLDNTYIGILMDNDKVILQVEGKTLEMRPEAFSALRKKLRMLD